MVALIAWCSTTVVLWRRWQFNTVLVYCSDNHRLSALIFFLTYLFGEGPEWETSTRPFNACAICFWVKHDTHWVLTTLRYMVRRTTLLTLNKNWLSCLLEFSANLILFLATMNLPSISTARRLTASSFNGIVVVISKEIADRPGGNFVFQ